MFKNTWKTSHNYLNNIPPVNLKHFAKKVEKKLILTVLKVKNCKNVKINSFNSFNRNTFWKKLLKLTVSTFLPFWLKIAEWRISHGQQLKASVLNYVSWENEKNRKWRVFCYSKKTKMQKLSQNDKKHSTGQKNWDGTFNSWFSISLGCYSEMVKKILRRLWFFLIW